MKTNEDIKSDVTMYFEQINALLDLMIENSSDANCNINLFTLKNIAENGLASAKTFEI